MPLFSVLPQSGNDEPVDSSSLKLQIVDRYGRPYRRLFEKRRRKQSLWNGQVTWMDTHYTRVKNKKRARGAASGKGHAGVRFDKEIDMHRLQQLQAACNRPGRDTYNEYRLAFDNIYEDRYGSVDDSSLWDDWDNDWEFLLDDEDFDTETSDESSGDDFPLIMIIDFGGPAS